MPRLALWCTCFFLACATFALAQEDIIEDVKVLGNTRMADDSILFRISSKPGLDLNPARVTQDIKDLWATGLFDNIGVIIQDGQNGKILTYVVRELPIVVSVDYRGNNKLTKSSITDKIEEQRLTIPEDSPLDYKKINAVRVLIKKLLAEKGLRYATVEYKLEPLRSGTARVVFDINEGSKVRIHEIEFTGNTVYSNRKLRKIMKKTAEHWMFSWLTSHDIYREDNFAEDVDLLKSAYWKKGFKDIYVGEPILEITDHTTEKQKRKNERREKRRKPLKKDMRLKLTIPLFEGSSYVMGNFEVEGNTVLPTVFYEKSFPLAEGDLYDYNKIDEWVETLEENHNNAGYIHFNAVRNVKIRDDKVVDLSYEIRENDQVYIHRLGFKGNVTTRDKVLRREVLLREGDVFRLNFFRNSILRISQLGFFDVKNYQPDVTLLPDENKANITIVGQESGVNELNFGLGFSDLRGTSGFLSFSTLNFLGKGEKLKVQAQVGSITDTFDITFTEPWLFDKPRGLSTRIFNTRSDFSASGFTLESTGFQVGLSFRPSIFGTYTVSYLFSEDRFPTVNSPDFRRIDDLLTSSISQGYQYNTTDHPFFPSRGFKAGVNFQLAGWQFGGDNYFTKTTFNATKYLPSIKETFMGFNMKVGLLNTLEGQRPTANQLFFLGGEESVRGYRRQSLGPVVRDTQGQVFASRGDKFFQANWEYIFPISEQVRVVAFFDAGMVFGVDQDWFETNLARSTGVEMRFSLPIFQAPLRLIYAFKLDDTPREDKGGEFKFSIGTTF